MHRRVLNLLTVRTPNKLELPPPRTGAAELDPGSKASAAPRQRIGPGKAFTSPIIDLAADSDDESSKSVELARDGQGRPEASEPGDEELLARLDGPAAGKRARAVQTQQTGRQPQTRR